MKLNKLFYSFKRMQMHYRHFMVIMDKLDEKLTRYEMKQSGADDEFIDEAILAAKQDNQRNASYK